jgi:hypothetical protein
MCFSTCACFATPTRGTTISDVAEGAISAGVTNEFAEEVEDEVAVSLDELENLQTVSVEECNTILIKF